MLSHLLLFLGAGAAALILLLVTCCNVYYWGWHRKRQRNEPKRRFSKQKSAFFREGFNDYEVLTNSPNIPTTIQERTPTQAPNTDADDMPYPPTLRKTTTAPEMTAMWQQRAIRVTSPATGKTTRIASPGREKTIRIASPARDETTRVTSPTREMTSTYARRYSLSPTTTTHAAQLSAFGPSQSMTDLRGSPRSHSLPHNVRLENPAHARRRSYMAHEIAYDPLKESNPPPKQITSLPDSLLTSMSSLDSDTSSNASRLGRLQLRVAYVPSDEVIRFHLIKALDLPAMDAGGSSDPYVEVSLVDTKMLLADGHVLKKFSSWKSKVHDKTLNPVFDETHDFECPLSVPAYRLSFLIYIYDYDVVSRDDLIGHVWLPLKDLDLSLYARMWKTIEPGKRITSSNLHREETLGEVVVSLSYSSPRKHLIIVVHGARNLPRSGTTPPDTCVKVRMYHRDYKLASKETPKVRASCDPEYDKVFHYQLSKEASITQILISITVVHHGVITKKPIGMVNLGLGTNAHQSGVAQWRDVLANEEKKVTAIHKLRGYAAIDPPNSN